MTIYYHFLKPKYLFLTAFVLLGISNRISAQNVQFKCPPRGEIKFDGDCSDLLPKYLKPRVAAYDGKRISEYTRKFIPYVYKCLDENEDFQSSSPFYYGLANVLYVHDTLTEKVIPYLKKSYELDSEDFCRSYNSRRSVGYSNKFEFHFLDLIADEEVAEMRASCYGTKNEKYPTINDYLAEIMKNDQKHRSPQYQPEQAPLDERNRDLVDEMMRGFGFPDDNHAQFTIWLVYHHSMDKKWNDRMLRKFHSLCKSGRLTDNIKELVPKAIERQLEYNAISKELVDSLDCFEQ